jgi:hypothetical protein
MRVLVVLALAVPACAADDSPPDPAPADVLLSIDVELSDSSLALLATEPERPCECSVGWTDVGECRTQSDGIDCACEPWPASCLEEVTLLADGEPLASGRWDPMWWGLSLQADTARADQLAIAGCGTEVVVDLPERVRPEVSLDLVYPQGSSPVVLWSTEPAAASAVISVGDGFAADSCHRLGGAGEVEVPTAAEGWSVSVTGLARPVFTGTALGEVRLWFGNTSALRSDR